MINYQVTSNWNESLWRKVEPVYREAFPEHRGKSEGVIRRMFQRKLSELHTWMEAGEVVAMALTATDRGAHVLVIDYLAVRASRRGGGLGRHCVEAISEWAKSSESCRAVVIEVEAERTEENAERIKFWLRTGFQLTSYVHPYIWVPETYQAMYLPLEPAFKPEDDGRSLFKFITKYHEKAYRGGDIE
ncbi:GNAT family N-acetyltransferase [Paenibacillus lignilyticus]|uniref:GNAT family N-acetyltransferase n=1 Tax=Paenibacillus lignilyticus TaxID=1172615 RepID=A0ABS5CK45_9BACL|nr:GNAT family N-acetyltransferase [Paenibacillus lignilyticus]MBP3966242.1 GNAT family N-acetyltransferase [Paenibacillus lignilyticus]